ncbi:MAG: lysine 5,6-aminomutase subunit alpha [Sandaracinaceae bacterium]|nr:lysine 5,6-aminomutase subunit alpha [Sandaracinaceae bacterium]
MAQVPLDMKVVDECRRLAASIADDVQRFIDKHTTVGVERTVARAFGIEGVDDQGIPLVNMLVDRIHAQKLLGRGVAFFLGRELLRGAPNLQDAAERLAYGRSEITGEGPETEAQINAVLEQGVKTALKHMDDARDTREAMKARLGMADNPWKYVIVATGNIYDDAIQAKSAAHGGADVVAVIRATAQSLLDYVPHGATTEGYGGTYATQENFKIVRRALDEASEEFGRYCMQTNYSSGLCMSEIAYMAAVERLDMLLNDSMYGILFRDINMQRTFVDQYFSRRLIARSKIIINTGEDNYLTTADAVDAAHTVLASQFINEAFAHRAGVADENLGLGHAYEINPWLEDSFLLELSQAQLVRQIFPNHPIKWMPPTKFKTGDVFHSHVHDAMFNLVGITTKQSIELLGMFSEAIHTPLLMDRYLSLKSTKYIYTAAKHLGDEIEFKKDGIIETRARVVLNEAVELLTTVQRDGIWDSISRGAFADVKRTLTGGKGLAGVVERERAYVNPILSMLEGGAA